MNPRTKLTTAQAARYLHVSVSTLKRYRACRKGPTWMKPGDGINSPVLYEVADLDQWVNGRKQ